jgi:hypothetical protein
MMKNVFLVKAMKTWPCRDIAYFNAAKRAKGTKHAKIFLEK